MKRSHERILTTHTGSLPRPPDLVDLMARKEHGDLTAADQPVLDARVRSAVAEIIRTQLDLGLDVINDGEMSKLSYSTYVTERLTGFAGETRERDPSIDATRFPEFFHSRTAPSRVVLIPSCTGPVTWTGSEQVERDVANFRAGLQGVTPADAFMSAASPGVIWYYLPNAYYPTHEAYMYALADAMKHEYDAIHRAGFLVQVDCPDMAGGWNRLPFLDKQIEDFREFVELHVAVLNRALADIPPDRLRMHVCWGNYQGPHMRDIPLRHIVDILLKARPQALSFEAANPRHEHEWKIFADVKLPDGKILMPGMLDSTTNYVEHPELIAERIVRYAGLVGCESVIAGSDCGYSIFAGHTLVHPTIVWEKLRALAEGARLASSELWR